MVTEQTIEQYLRDLGISYERLEGFWHIGFRGDVKDIDMQVRLTESMLSESMLIVIAQFVNTPRKNRAAIYKRLLELNYEMDLAKFSVDSSEGDVYLMIEVPADNLTLEQFERAVMYVAQWHDQYYGQVVALMYSPVEEDADGDDLGLSLDPEE